MENTSTKPSAKTIIMWAIPIVILVFLIVLLIMELTSVDDIGFNEDGSNKEEIIQPTQVDDGEAIVDLEPAKETETTRKPSEALFGTKQETTFLTDTKTEGEDEKIVMDESERSFIMEEGDSLWKIAQRRDVLDDPRKWKTILIQNREKINYTIFSEETGQWKVMVDAGKRLVFKPKETAKTKMSFDRSRKKRYAVQLMSLNVDQLEKAVDIVKFLITDGYHAYLYRTRDKIKPPSSSVAQYFYRIRVGFYETEQEALDVGEEIVYRYEGKRIFPQDFWAVLPSYSELNGELIDFGIQRNKPFIIQLAVRDSREEAINDLKTITPIVDFSYISQKQNEQDQYQYRIRVGFFETQEEAQKTLSKIQAGTRDRFYHSRILEIRHVMETAPGQSTGETSIDKIQQ